MSTPASLFAALVREAPAPEDDAPDPTSFTEWCDACRTETRFRRVARIGTQDFYMCDGCSNTRVYGKEPK